MARSKEKEKEKNVEKAKQESHAHEVHCAQFVVFIFQMSTLCFPMSLLNIRLSFFI